MILLLEITSTNINLRYDIIWILLQKTENRPYETKYNTNEKNIYWKMGKTNNKNEVLWAYAISHLTKGGSWNENTDKK